MAKRVWALSLMLVLTLPLTNVARAADYVIDREGGHASIEFRVSHLGYSWLTGRFNQFDGWFRYDAEAPEQARVEVEIDPASIDSNHAERDKHLRGKNFLHVQRYRVARFVGTGLRVLDKDRLLLSGKLTLHGYTRPIDIQLREIGQGWDSQGNYRLGFSGSALINTSDFGMKSVLRKESRQVELILEIEGIRQ